MANNSTNVADVVAKAETARLALIKLDHLLQHGADEIEFGLMAANRSPNAHEVEALSEACTVRAGIRETNELLAYATTKRLETEREVERLLRRLETIGFVLQSPLQRLKRNERYAVVVQQVRKDVGIVHKGFANLVANPDYKSPWGPP